MITVLADAGFPGPPHRIRTLAKVLKRYDYESERDFVGCDVAPLPHEFTNLLSDPEKGWFSEYVASLNSASRAPKPSTQPAPALARGHSADQFNALKSSLNCLRVHRTETKDIRIATLRALADLGIRSWHDLVGANDSLLHGSKLPPRVRTLCIDLIDAANEQKPGEERPAKISRQEHYEKDGQQIHACPLSIIADTRSAAASTARNVGPAAACQQLAATFTSVAERKSWLEHARVQAVLDSCPHSHKSILSGLRCWNAFAQHILNKRQAVFPPTVDEILAWSTLFRCGATFANYVNYLRTGCALIGVSAAACADPSIKRAKVAIEKRRQFVRRERRFIQQRSVTQLIRATVENDEDPFGMAILTTYVFLLRMPSECLPIEVHSGGRPDGCAAAITINDSEIILDLKRRKNRPGGSRLIRRCWCHDCKETCPLHVLGKYMRSLGDGSRPFALYTPGRALQLLRSYLAIIGVSEAQSYRTHDLRRGHARDLQVRGASLMEILRAGEWRSPAFLNYLDLEELERDAVVEAHLGESSDSDDISG